MSGSNIGPSSVSTTLILILVTVNRRGVCRLRSLGEFIEMYYDGGQLSIEQFEIGSQLRRQHKERLNRLKGVCGTRSC